MGTINIPDQEERLEMGVVGMTPLEAFIEEHNETRAKFSKIETTLDRHEKSFLTVREHKKQVSIYNENDVHL